MSRLDNLSARERTAVFIGVVVLLCLLGDFVVARRISDRFGEMDMEIKNKGAELTFNEKMLAREGQIIAQWEQAGPYVPVKAEMETEDQRELQSLLTAIYKKSGVDFENMKLMDTESYRYHSNYLVQLDVSGEREAMMNLVYSIENAHRKTPDTGLLTIRQLSLQPVDANGSETLQASIVISKIVSR